MQHLHLSYRSYESCSQRPEVVAEEGLSWSAQANQNLSDQGKVWHAIASLPWIDSSANPVMGSCMFTHF